MNKFKIKKKGSSGITLIALIITIVILLILAGITIAQLTNTGLFKNAKTASEENQKAEATETMNLKITNIEMASYVEKQEMPTLQYVADKLCEDDEVEDVKLSYEEIGKADKITVGEEESIYTKLAKYPYVFEIDKELKLASVDGIKIATAKTTRIEELEQENIGLNTRIQELERQNAEFIEEKDSLQQQIISLTGENEQLQQQIGNAINLDDAEYIGTANELFSTNSRKSLYNNTKWL